MQACVASLQQLTLWGQVNSRWNRGSMEIQTRLVPS
jgi:hypothetical protein